MNGFEERAQRLRAAVVDVAERVDAEALYDRLGVRSARRGPDGAVLAGTAAAAAIVIVVVVVSQLLSPQRPRIEPLGPPGHASPDATPDSRGGGTGTDALAVLDDRQGVVALDVRTGEVTREVVARGFGEGLADVAYSRARDSILVARVMTACRTEVVEIPLSGGEERVLGVGRDVAVSADGTRYAVAHEVSGACGAPSVSIEVGTVAGGVHHRWTAPAGEEGPSSVTDLTWSSDAHHLAFALHFGDGTEVRVLDASDTSSERLEAASRKLQAPPERPVAWTAPAYRGESLTLVEGPALGSGDEVPTWRVREVDPGTGEVTRTLLETHRAVTDLDWAPGGEQLLYIERHVDHDRSAEPPTLFRWADGRSEPVRSGVRAVIWGTVPAADDPGDP